MTSRSATEILGYEFDWLGCDSSGHVALFSTAGGSFAPPEFLAPVTAIKVGSLAPEIIRVVTEIKTPWRFADCAVVTEALLRARAVRFRG